MAATRRPRAERESGLIGADDCGSSDGQKQEGGYMRKAKSLAIALMVLVFASCASFGENWHLQENTLTAVRPNLAIQFKKDVAEIKERGIGRAVLLKDRSVSPVFIWISREINTNSIDYYYSLPNIISNWDGYYLGPEHFGEMEWAKMAIINESNYLLCGYLTRKDHDIICVHNAMKLSDAGLKDFEQFKKQFKPTQANLDLIAQQFEALNATMEIQY